MGLLRQLLARYKELVVYCLIGCTGAGLDFLIYAVLTECLHLHYQFANFVSSSFGIANNFLFNYYLNFKVRGRMFARLASFYAIGMCGLTLSACCLWMLIERFGLNAVVAKVGTLAFIAIIQFCLNKFLTFRKISRDKEEENV